MSSRRKKVKIGKRLRKNRRSLEFLESNKWGIASLAAAGVTLLTIGSYGGILYGAEIVQLAAQAFLMGAGTLVATNVVTAEYERRVLDDQIRLLPQKTGEVLHDEE